MQLSVEVKILDDVLSIAFKSAVQIVDPHTGQQRHDRVEEPGGKRARLRVPFGLPAGREIISLSSFSSPIPIMSTRRSSRGRRVREIQQLGNVGYPYYETRRPMQTARQ